MAPSRIQETLKLCHIWDSNIPGGAVARNRAMEIADGDIWVFLDDDVYLESDFLEQIVAVYLRHPQVSGVSGMITNYCRPSWTSRCWSWVFARGPFHDERQPIYWQTDALRYAEPIPVNKFTGACMSFLAELIRKHRFDENLRGLSVGEDIDFCLRLKPGKILVIAPRARLIHKQSPLERSRKHWLKREVQAAFYLYTRNWNKGVKNKLFFTWLIVGYAFLATIASLRRRSVEPWRAFLEGTHDRSGDVT